MKLYYGTDLVKIERLAAAMSRHTRLRERLFTAGESAHAEQRGAMEAASLAGIFAAKEAAVKALGTGFAGAKWRDAEIVWEQGAPQLHLYGVLAERAAAKGITGATVSISHEKKYAVAGVVLWGGQDVTDN